MRLTKLETIALGNIASDLRRSANKLTRIAFNEHSLHGADDTREYQKSNVRHVMNDIEEIMRALKQMEQVLCLDHDLFRGVI